MSSQFPHHSVDLDEEKNHQNVFLESVHRGGGGGGQAESGHLRPLKNKKILQITKICDARFPDAPGIRRVNPPLVCKKLVTQGVRSEELGQNPLVG